MIGCYDARLSRDRNLHVSSRGRLGYRCDLRWELHTWHSVTFVYRVSYFYARLWGRPALTSCCPAVLLPVLATFPLTVFFASYWGPVHWFCLASPHSFGFGIGCRSLALFIFLLFIASFLRSFNMFSLARRRFLDGLGRRYIYGRVVCIYFSTPWPFRTTRNSLSPSPLLHPSTKHQKPIADHAPHLLNPAPTSRYNLSDWDGDRRAAGGQVQLLLCGEAG